MLPGKNLVEQMLLGGMDYTVPVTQLLRVARVAASRLDLNNMQSFLDNEENGYFDQRTLPDYRLLAGDLQWVNPMRGWVPIPINPELPYRNAVGEVVALLDTRENFYRLGVDFGASVAEALGLDFVPTTCILVSRSALVGIIEGVRNRLHKWAVELDKAGVRGEGLDFSLEDKRKAQTVTVNHFHGPVAGVAQGGSRIQLTRQDISI